ncbi:MAG: adenosylcobinamide-GDP ribazoletransferase, partial [Acetomicrobium flavidum]|nr:adenosylcobinamide-GDP ribazoletransferase [Acetomicrobium flavidum]
MRFVEILAASFSFFSRIPVPAILLPEGEPPYGMMLALSPIVGGVLGALWGGLGVLLSLKFAALGAAWSS